MKIVGIIPARYKSTRFPGKPLADICGKPMIWHVYQRAIKAKLLDEVYIATDDKRIQDACSQMGLN
ncbi:NTP transferase domain-containing protein, partial [bacterium]|nr:NTP transferase domain-containing protein [bacterium]